jgi:2-polyprenyl-3-methyl-5-hydroxy-6-metoxy-1,4-benzoquinol methylase
VTPIKLRMRDPAGHWERFGRLDPYYGVYSLDEFHRGNLGDVELERFFASGEEHVEKVFGSIRRSVASDFTPATVLDHGCGVGRLLIPFARRVERVVGLDVSPSMLREARRNCDMRGLAHVELLTADRLDALAPEFDLVHSFIVLQHIPPRKGEQIFETLASLVRPGGVGVVQVPIAAAGWRTRAHTWTIRRVPYASNLANVLHHRPWSYPHMQMNVYRLNSLARLLMRQGYEDVHAELLAGDPGRPGYASCMMMFRRR